MRTLATISILFATSITGCGPAATDVTGSVTFEGKTVVFGTVVIIGTDGLPRSGAIQPDGTYRVSGVPLGAAKVAISSPRPPGMKVPNAKPKTGRDEGLDERRPADENATVDPVVAKGWFALPEKYGDPATANLTLEVTANLVFNFELK